MSCPTPKKVRFTEVEAIEAARRMKKKLRHPIHPYACPGGGHWHVGHDRSKGRSKRKKAGR